MQAVMSVLAMLVGMFFAGLGSPAVAEEINPLDSFLSGYRADVGSSVSLGDGRVLWLFGDTIRADGSWDRNSAVVQFGSQFSEMPGTFLNHRYSDHWYWPGQAIREGNLLRVLAQDYIRTGDGSWDWRYDHTDLLTFSLPGLTPVGRTALPKRSSGAMWGQIYRARYYTYLYGSYSVPGQTGKAYEVARVPNGKLAYLRAWRYLGTRMTPDLELGTVSSVVRKSAGGYRLFSKRLDMWSHEIISYDSSTPYGPWTNMRVVASIPVSAGKWTYAVETHREQPGDLTLTYATNCGEDTDPSTPAFDCPDYHLSRLSVPRP